MKKTIITFLILSLLILPSCKNGQEKQFEGQKLSYTKMIDPGRNIIRFWKYRYNPQGEISTTQRCAEDGTCLQRNEYTYNEAGLTETETIYLAGKKVLYNVFTYDDTKKLISKKAYIPEGFTETFYFYLPDGKNDFEEDRDKDGNLIKTKVYIYDEVSGNKIKERSLDANSNYLGGTEFTYENDLLVKMEYVGNASEEFSCEEYTYEGENIVKKIFYDKAGNLIYTDFLEYDQNGCSKQTRQDKDGNIVYIWTSHYADFITLIG